MEKLSIEKSTEQAKIIRSLSFFALQLDGEYLKAALKEMKDLHSFKHSAMALNPSPFAAKAKNDLEAAKLDQLEMMIDLANNAKTIIDCEAMLIKAKESESELSKIFGI
jgi:hypothetical protein